MVEVGLVTAYVAGFFTFFAPCTLPLVPPFIAYLAGNNARNKVVVTALFCLGFATIFILLGIGLGSFSSWLIEYRNILISIGGFIMVLMGGLLLLKPSFASSRTVGFDVNKYSDNPHINSFVLGAIFATTFSPCLGPILGSILALAAVSTDIFASAILLTIYSLGLSTPFLVTALFYNQWQDKFSKIKPKILSYIQAATAVMIVVFGLILATGQFGNVIYEPFSTYENLFIERFVDYL